MLSTSDSQSRALPSIPLFRRWPSQGRWLLFFYLHWGVLIRRNQLYWFLVTLYRNVLIPAKSLEMYGPSYSSSNQRKGLLCLSQRRECDYMAAYLFLKPHFKSCLWNWCKIFLEKPKLLQSWFEVDSRTQMGSMAGLGGQPSPWWPVGPVAHLWSTKGKVTHDVTAFFQPLEPQEHMSSEQTRLYDYQSEFFSKDCREFADLHKIIGSQGIREKGVSIFPRGAESSVFHVISNQIYGKNRGDPREVIHSFIHSFIFFSILSDYLFVLASRNIEIIMNNTDEQYIVTALSIWHIVGTQ